MGKADYARPRVIRGTRVKPLPLLPSRPGAVCSRPLHGARDLTNFRLAWAGKFARRHVPDSTYVVTNSGVYLAGEPFMNRLTRAPQLAATAWLPLVTPPAAAHVVVNAGTTTPALSW